MDWKEYLQKLNPLLDRQKFLKSYIQRVSGLNVEKEKEELIKINIDIKKNKRE